MDNGELKGKVFSGLFWKFGERIGAQGVSFLVSVVLARLLTPDDFGSIAILLIFIDIANVFVTSSFGVALVQKKDADEYDFSSVFYFNILFSFIVYVLFYIAAPLIAAFYEIESLTPMMRILALKLPLSGINSIQHAYVEKHMQFKKFFFSTIIGTVISAIIGIYLAFAGWGAYALIAQYLTNSLCDTIILWFTIQWKPQAYFSLNRLKPLIKFGWKMLVSSLLSVFYSNLRSFVIGKVYSSEDLAYYNQGQKVPSMVVNNIVISISSVLFPAMVTSQNDIPKLKNFVRRSISTGLFVMCPMMFGLFSVAEEVVVLLFTEKWLPCVIFMQILCIQCVFEPVQISNIQAIKAMGRSDVILKLEIIKKGYGILALLLSMKYGVIAIALSGATQTVVALICNTYPNVKFLNYKYSEQISDIIPPVFSALIMMVSVIFVKSFLQGNILSLIIQIIVGCIVYIIMSFFVQRNNFIFILSLVKDKIKH